MKANALAVFLTVALSMAGCSSLETMAGKTAGNEAESLQTPAITVKPELDYSSEYPNCVVAGQRLADNVEVGMTLKEVKRLVGQPRWRIPGSWWWSKSFSEAGKPLVRFAFQKGRDDTVITGIDTDTSRCEPSES